MSRAVNNCGMSRNVPRTNEDIYLGALETNCGKIPVNHVNASRTGRVQLTNDKDDAPLWATRATRCSKAHAGAFCLIRQIIDLRDRIYV
jgi:hypothetical protein